MNERKIATINYKIKKELNRQKFFYYWRMCPFCFSPLYKKIITGYWLSNRQWTNNTSIFHQCENCSWNPDRYGIPFMHLTCDLKNIHLYQRENICNKYNKRFFIRLPQSLSSNWV
jgi:hypothetical protein